MELNDYQTEVIDDLKNYLYWLNTNQVLDRAFVDHWKNKPSGISYETKPYKNTIAGVPHVCLKVPTGGGKTFLAVNAIKPMMDSLYELAPYRPAFVVWLVPSRTILEQTYQQLSDPQHPYHRKLAQHFNGGCI
jgi:type III restriction enzyme